MKQDFKDLIDNLRNTIADYKYYTDFDKVYRNVNGIKVELNILNSLIGSEHIESDFIHIINEYPKTLKVIPLLLAIRKSGNTVPVLDGRLKIFKFNKRELSDRDYLRFMRESGLFDLLENSKIKNLFDYVTGVEVGLDTNARKNRTGTTMENIVEGFIKMTNHIAYTKETTKDEIKRLYGVDLDLYLTSEESLKIAEKRFDFVIKTNENLFVVETNFYSGGGSKLNETARSFKSLASDFRDNSDVTFIWITDGVGWKTARNNLRETYDVMKHLYTLTDLENGVLNQVIK
ncbi:MAG: type II restriction endonuclease [Candidatus Izemoplasmatales bacterium]|jgi:type II restriction enzyme|nr:type II restriction endonuclease [Candidatus Izemoplasmatales bacterium]